MPAIFRIKASAKKASKVETSQTPLNHPQRLNCIQDLLQDKEAILIGFSTTATCLSGFIRWATKAIVSHTWVSFVQDNVRWVVGSEESGLKWETWDAFTSANIIKAVFEPTHEGIKKATSLFLAEQFAAPYDWGAAGTLGLQAHCPWLWKHCGKWLRNKLVRAERFMCVEVPILILKSVSCPLASTLDHETTNAQQLMLGMMNHTQSGLFKPIYLTVECERAHAAANKNVGP